MHLERLVTTKPGIDMAEPKKPSFLMFKAKKEKKCRRGHLDYFHNPCIASSNSKMDLLLLTGLPYWQTQSQACWGEAHPQDRSQCHPSLATAQCMSEIMELYRNHFFLVEKQRTCPSTL